VETNPDEEVNLLISRLVEFLDRQTDTIANHDPA